MCCELCPQYHDCAARDKLKERCCKICPDIESCYPAEDEEDEGPDL